MTTNQLGQFWPTRIIQATVASVLGVTLWSAGAFAQVGLQNGNLLPGNAANAPTAAWSQIGATKNGLTPQLPGWTLTGQPNNPGIDCLALTNTLTTSTQFCGTSYGATLNQVPPGPGSGAGNLPLGYTGNILVADANPSYNNGISQTVLGLTKNTNYTLTFYFSGAQQQGFTGTSLDDWQVSYGATSGTSSVTTPQISVPNSPGSPVWAKQTVSFNTGNSTQEFISFLAQSNQTVNDPPFMMLADISLTASPVPEPASLALLGAGLAGLIGLRRRARRAVV